MQQSGFQWTKIWFWGALIIFANGCECSGELTGGNQEENALADSVSSATFQLGSYTIQHDFSVSNSQVDYPSDADLAELSYGLMDAKAGVDVFHEGEYVRPKEVVGQQVPLDEDEELSTMRFRLETGEEVAVVLRFSPNAEMDFDTFSVESVSSQIRMEREGTKVTMQLEENFQVSCVTLKEILVAEGMQVAREDGLPLSTCVSEGETVRYRVSTLDGSISKVYELSFPSKSAETSEPEKTDPETKEPTDPSSQESSKLLGLEVHIDGQPRSVTPLGNAVVVSIPYGLENPCIELHQPVVSEGATIASEPQTDAQGCLDVKGLHRYTIVAPNGVDRTQYTIRFETQKNTKALIHSASASGVEQVKVALGEISVVIPHGLDMPCLSDLQLEVSSNAVVSIEKSAPDCLGDGSRYVLTSEDGLSSNTYVLRLLEGTPPDLQILSFTVDIGGEVIAATVEQQEVNVYVTQPVDCLRGESIKVSPEASWERSDGSGHQACMAQDGTLQYRVKNAFGSFVEYVVQLILQRSDAGNVALFSVVDEMQPATIDDSGITVYLGSNTSLDCVKPTVVEVSEKATVLRTDGFELLDCLDLRPEADPISYLVTSESGVPYRYPLRTVILKSQKTEILEISAVDQVALASISSQAVVLFIDASDSLSCVRLDSVELSYGAIARRTDGEELTSCMDLSDGNLAPQLVVLGEDGVSETTYSITAESVRPPLAIRSMVVELNGDFSDLVQVLVDDAQSQLLVITHLFELPSQLRVHSVELAEATDTGIQANDPISFDGDGVASLTIHRDSESRVYTLQIEDRPIDGVYSYGADSTVPELGPAIWDSTLFPDETILATFDSQGTIAPGSYTLTDSSLSKSYGALTEVTVDASGVLQLTAGDLRSIFANQGPTQSPQEASSDGYGLLSDEQRHRFHIAYNFQHLRAWQDLQAVRIGLTDKFFSHERYCYSRRRCF